MKTEKEKGFTYLSSFISRFVLSSREVGKAVGKIIALALGLDANFFDQPQMLGESIATLRLLHYEGIESMVSVSCTLYYNYKG